MFVLPNIYTVMFLKKLLSDSSSNQSGYTVPIWLIR